MKSLLAELNMRYFNSANGYLYILIFCAGVVAGVVAVPIAPRRYIRPIFRTIPAPNIVAPYLWIKYSIAECTRIKCVAVCLH